MAAYSIVRYNTGVKDTFDEALEALETKLETLDDSTNTIRGIDLVFTGRDKEQCIGWLLYDG